MAWQDLFFTLGSLTTAARRSHAAHDARSFWTTKADDRNAIRDLIKRWGAIPNMAFKANLR